VAVTMFGIPNCDTIKKARTWLDGHGVPFDFHDYKKSGVDADALRAWVDELGWEVLLNRAGTTFRALPDGDKQGIDAAKAIRLMLANPSMIKRPVLDLGDRRIVGFKPEAYAEVFA
jgi:arsenate reductase